ncbi:hypothetical protein LIER_05514 [Lithospermum erythrorhizon]|uniref:GPI transamidase component PIG-T n=1 Tax=Lithospermum erythrorhizon TaxID=34254 RepID=A0AAV3P0Y1_LITER
MSRLQYLFLVIFLLFFVSKSKAKEELEAEEEFSEALLLRPLPDRKVLAHFHFQISVPPTQTYVRHHHLFPKSIYQLVQKFRIRELELSFTQGRWNYERWGGYDPISSSVAKPPGVELWAVFDVPKNQVDSSWKNLTHALSGLFCASINFLEDSTTYSSPEWTFRHSGNSLRYGTLPREAVCTENLTPWLKLLPCRDKAGLAALMDRPSIYRGSYHSQKLHITVKEYGAVESNSGIILQQTLSVVLQPPNLGIPSKSKLQPSWSLSSLFGREVSGKCILSKSSHVYIQFEQNLVSELKRLEEATKASNTEVLSSGFSSNNPSFELSVSPNRVIKEVASSDKGTSVLFEFSVDHYRDLKPFDLKLNWKLPASWSCEQAPFHVSRFLMGSGNERGAIAISLTSTGKNVYKQGATEGGVCHFRVNIFQFVPWYVKVYYHTLRIYTDEQLQPAEGLVEKMRVSPSEDKVSPGVMEMVLKLSCGVKTAALTLEFDKGFLHIDEYPPDANQGFDIPSALVNFADFQTKMHFVEDDSLENAPILSNLKETRPVLAYTEVLLVPLTTPDFSMPYNVITITCTVFALYFGSLLNALRRRIGEEERLLKDKERRKGPLTMLLSRLSAKLRGKPIEPPEPSSSSTSSHLVSRKLISKILLVAGVAAIWQFYLE